MSAERRSLFSPRLVVGVVVLAFGSLLLLENTGILAEADPYLRQLWPVGAFALAGACWLHRSRGWALIWAAVGALLALRVAGVPIPLDFGSLVLPVLLLLLGVTLVRRALLGPRPAEAGEGGATVDAMALFGASVRRSSSQAFRGGSLTAAFGGCELDLTEAATPSDGATLDVFAAFGAIEISVPQGWKVAGDVLPIFGGFEDKTRRVTGEPTGLLTVRGQVLFGGIEVKNG